MQRMNSHDGIWYQIVVGENKNRKCKECGSPLDPEERNLCGSCTTEVTINSGSINMADYNVLMSYGSVR